MVITSGCASSLVGEKWVAKVNGEIITLPEYNARVNKAQAVYKELGMDFETEQGKQDLTNLKQQILSGMVHIVIYTQEVKRLKLNTDDQKVKEEVEKYKASLGDNPNKNLDMQGQTEQDVVNWITLYSYVTKDIASVSDSDVQAYFNQNKATMYDQQEQVEAKHILVNTEEEANSIIAQLKAGATPSQLFDQLAKEKSIDPGSKDQGGELGYFTKDAMIPEFAEVAFTQQVGTFSQTPVKSEYGYHIIYVKDHKQPAQADFTKIKEQVEKDALNQAQIDHFQTYLVDLEKNSKIEYAKGYEPSI